MSKRGNFIAIDAISNEILTDGQSIYTYESSARRGISQYIRKENRSDYVIVELTKEDVIALLQRKRRINADGN